MVQALAPCPQTEARQENYGQHRAVLTRDTNTSTARVSQTVRSKYLGFRQGTGTRANLHSA